LENARNESEVAPEHLLITTGDQITEEEHAGLDVCSKDVRDAQGLEVRIQEEQSPDNDEPPAGVNPAEEAKQSSNKQPKRFQPALESKNKSANLQMEADGRQSATVSI